MKYILVLFFIITHQCHISSQNLVLNASFESLGKYNIPQFWTPISPSVDVIVEGRKVFEKAYADEYGKLYSKYMPPKGSDGLSYICLFKHGEGTEAISSKLNSKLRKGVRYNISLDLYKPLIPAKFPAFEMSVVFSSESEQRCGTQQCLSDPLGNIVKLSSQTHPVLHEGKWITVKGEYVADGSEEFITLCHPSSINRPLVKNNNVISYFFDNLTVEEFKDVAELELLYKTGSHQLNSKNKELIDLLLPSSFDSISIVGKASPLGNVKDNIKLSIQRAQKVAKYIEEKYPIINVGVVALGEDNGNGTQSVLLKCYRSFKKEFKEWNADSLYSVIRSIHYEYNLDQIEAKKIDTERFDELKYKNHVSALDIYINGLLDFGVLRNFKIDTKSENKLIAMILHSTDQFQLSIFPLLQSSFNNQLIDIHNFAYIVDRYKMISNLPQVYGTQLVKENRKLVLYKTESIDSLDTRRTEMGLSNIREYLKEVNN